MRRIALLSLVHDRGKLLASLAGVAFAAVLVLVQSGLYIGFREASSSLIKNVGGDLWIAGRGAPAVDNGETLSSGVRSLALSQPGVAHVRGIIFAFSGARKRNGGIEYVQLIGTEKDTEPLCPWSMEQGLPQDIHAPSRMATDRVELAKLDLPPNPIGATLEVGGETLHVAGVTRGIHSVTLTPYIFTDIETARRILNLGEDQATFWVVDLADKSAAPLVKARLEQDPEIDVRTTDEIRETTADYWVEGSGAGMALLLSALLGVVVGVVIVGQTLYGLTKEHLKELATLKAIGATGPELARFVTVQAAFLGVVGGGAGVLLSFAAREVIAAGGLLVVLSPGVLALGIGTIAGICAVASIGSVRAVLEVEAARVFQ